MALNLNRNLLNNPIILEKEVNHAPGFYKSIIIDVLGVLTALWLGLLYRHFLSDQASLLWVAIALAIFCLISILQTLLIHSVQRRVWIIILEVLLMMGPFYAMNWELLLGTGVLAIFFLIWGDISARHEFRNNLKMRFFNNIRPLINKVVTAAVLVAVLLYLPQVSTPQSLISQQSFEGIFGVVTKALDFFYPGVAFNSSVGDMAQGLAQNQLQSNTAYQSLSSIDKIKTLQIAGSQIMATLSQKFGVVLKADQSVSDAAYQAFLAALSSWKQQFGTGFLIGWAVILFFVIRSIGFFFAWALTIVGFVVYQLLLAADLVKIVGESAMHEQVYFS